jgi:hypothetical protein
MTMPPGEPTIPAGEPAVPAGERTVPAGSGGTGGVPPAGPGADEADDRGPILWLTGSTLAGLVVGAVLALAVGSGSSPATPTTTTAASTTTSTTTTTTSTTTTTTTPVPAPQITSFSVSPSAPTCLSAGQVLVSWSTLHAAVVTLTIDGVAFGTFGGAGSHAVPFACPPHTHDYGIVARGASGQPAVRSIPVTAGAPPPTTSSSTTTTT